MPRHVYLFSGASAVGKTSALKALLPLLEEGGTAPCVCKIDCLKTGDGALFQRMGLPCVTGLSGDICPDHFLVSNLPELWDWADRLKRDTLVIETAGLCHRCSPAGYGTDLLARWLLDRPACGSFEGDILRHTMPSGVCSYCVGEQRVGSAFQQGVVGKINFEEAEVCSL